MYRRLYLLLFICFCFTATYAGELPDSLQRLLDRSGSDKARIEILLEAANTDINTDPEEATRYATLALQMAQNAGNRALVAKSYYRLGTNAYELKTLDESHAWFLKASALYDSLRDFRGMALAYSALGDVVSDIGNGRKSIAYYTRAKENFLMAGDTVLGLYMDMSIAGILGTVMELTDSALALSLSILPEAQRMKDDGLVNKIIANIASFYAMQGNYQKALGYSLKALPYFESRGDYVMLALTYGEIATNYMLLKDYKNAEKYALLEYESNKKGKSQKGIVLTMQRLGEISMEMKDYEQAARWYHQTLNAKDSLFSTDMAAQVAEMQAKYETGKKDQELALQNAKLEQQEFIIFSSFGFLLLILGIAAMLWFNYRKINRLSKALSAQKTELQELNGVKDKLFSAISHDLRSPLAQVTGMLYMMQQGMMTEEKLKERTTVFLNLMHQTMQMLDNLLYWATSQMKGLRLNKTDIRIGELVEENLQLMRPEAAFKKIALIQKIEETATALADVNMMRLVLRNLISNAIKFTPENGSIMISAGTVGSGVRVEVSDTGIGMSPETIEALNASKQVNSKRGTKSEKGFGIGLQLCKDFVEQNGGNLEISSEPGRGSTFSFTLPVS